MANWYYVKDGAALGPYSEEAMQELILKGEVTFVTLVWNDSDSNNNGNGSYAFDTDLASFF
jgi:hypothetical protein